jgi:hypothetical protein
MQNMDEQFGIYRFTTFTIDPNHPSVTGQTLSLYRQDVDPSLPGGEPGLWEVAQVSFDDYDGEWYVDTLDYCIPLAIIIKLVAEAKALIKPSQESS